MRMLPAIWSFSRPHTIAGSVISIVSLYFILSATRLEHLPVLVMALIAGICCNLFIVGLNQIADINIDRINKPWLPLPAEKLSVTQAKIIISLALLISLSVSLYVTPWFFGIIAASAAIGWAYSMPPFHLKKHHFTAALAISSVRGLLVNIGAFVVFLSTTGQRVVIPLNLILLTVFITTAGIVIAWFKDLPDVKGDAQFKIRSLAIVYSSRFAYIAGTLMMMVAYLACVLVNIYSCLHSMETLQSGILLSGHTLLFIVFVVHSFSLRISQHHSLAKFYKRFWAFFFAEYLLYLVAYF
jgi:homogentisate phytyltransferase / homogentisate geranylgeranyltransferase